MKRFVEKNPIGCLDDIRLIVVGLVAFAVLIGLFLLGLYVLGLVFDVFRDLRNFIVEFWDIHLILVGGFLVLIFEIWLRYAFRNLRINVIDYIQRSERVLEGINNKLVDLDTKIDRNFTRVDEVYDSVLQVHVAVELMDVGVNRVQRDVERLVEQRTRGDNCV